MLIVICGRGSVILMVTIQYVMYFGFCGCRHFVHNGPRDALRWQCQRGRCAAANIYAYKSPTYLPEVATLFSSLLYNDNKLRYLCYAL